MNVRELFQRDIERPIDGVIKADDVKSLDVEMDEFVLTSEIEKQVERFLEEYNNYENANGVWISGFFGSGKSHLLKILSLLLGNHDFNGKSALDHFLGKCKDNVILQGSLRKACSIPSTSILFNIDQKANMMSKTETDSLIAVFVKVFDEMCGYYGKQAYIAQFERDLDSRGLYGKFKDAFSEIAGKPWETGREQALLEKTSIKQAYARITSEDENNISDILKEYSDKYKLSIEDFAEMVHEYIKKKGKDFRLNFFVDEIGQYIANNTKLMLNLQTIAESLNTKCRGRSWIIVTSQMDINSVVGDVTKAQANDFSKIMARFISLQLTGQTVDEVIEKRLLDKTDCAKNDINTLYDRESGDFKTIFGFVDGTRTYKGYRDKNHFINDYPFVPYQFELFQQVMESLSKHNAFQGKYTSVGARSMLSVFQQVVKKIGDELLGKLAPFDYMFDGIRATLVEQIQKDIMFAENNLQDKFAVRVLKALFLVKYVKGFNASLRNLSVLLLSGFGEDITVLKSNIEESLNLLETQTYIQRNGDLYEFLTDEEKDIEQEIKDISIDGDEILKELDRMIFDHVFRNTKVRHTNGQDYAFARKLDDHLFGRDQELSINIITPFYGNLENSSHLEAENMSRKELLVLMEPNKRLMQDLELYKKTEKYIRQSNSINIQDSVKLILDTKNKQNDERRSKLQSIVRELLKQAKYIVRGNQVSVSGDDAASRLTNAFQELVSRIYVNLRMLGSVNYSENDILQILKWHNMDSQLSEAEEELKSAIDYDRKNGVRTTLKRLLEKFSTSPYGWSQVGILCIIAKLHVRGNLEIRNNGELLEDEKLAQALRNSSLQERLLFELMSEVDPKQFANLKKCYQELFHSPPAAKEGRELVKEIGEELKKMDSELSEYISHEHEFPFLSVLTPIKVLVQKCLNQPQYWYFQDFLNEADEIIEARENTLDPIRSFMVGKQRGIYAEAKRFLMEQANNFDENDRDKVSQIVNILHDSNCYRGQKMQQAKGLMDELKALIETRCSETRQMALDKVNFLYEKLKNLPEYDTLLPEKRQRLEEEFALYTEDIKSQLQIPVIRDKARIFEEVKYSKLLQDITSSSRSKPGGEDTPAPALIIRIQDAKIEFTKPLLRTEDDVESYVSSVRATLLKAVQEGKGIQL